MSEHWHGWKWNSFWGRYERVTRDGALVSIGNAWDGGLRIKVQRATGGIYATTHERRCSGRVS